MLILSMIIFVHPNYTSFHKYIIILLPIGIDLGSIAKAKKKKKTKNRKRMGKLGNITRSSEDNLEVLFENISRIPSLYMHLNYSIYSFTH